MYRDFAADRSVGADEHSSTYRESASTVLKSFHVASATAEEEAELIMRRLVRNYLERSPLSHHEGQDGFRSSWGKLSDRACIGDLTFHDLRGTAVVRLAIAGATVPQIATFTGHSLKDVEAILDTHYLGCDVQLAEAVVLKLEARTKL